MPVLSLEETKHAIGLVRAYLQDKVDKGLIWNTAEIEHIASTEYVLVPEYAIHAGTLYTLILPELRRLVKAYGLRMGVVAFPDNKPLAAHTCVRACLCFLRYRPIEMDTGDGPLFAWANSKSIANYGVLDGIWAAAPPGMERWR